MMRLRWIAVVFTLLSATLFVHAQKPFQQFRDTAEDYSDYPLPPDWDEPAEFVLARLKYEDINRFLYGRSLYWTMDYPRGDRHLAQGIRRLTSTDVRSVEQVVQLDGSDDVYNWPFLYAVEVGMWDLTEQECAQLRNYLRRGGFLMVDDFHSVPEWENFVRNLDQIFAFEDYDIVDLNAQDPIFHTVADVNELIQIPSAQFMESGVTYEKGGITPRFRAVRDSRGRIVIAICHNMDLGDSVEHSDNPRYPERFSALGYRVMINYAIYALSH